MPIFTYQCDNGHEVDDLRPRSERNEPMPCPECPRLMYRAGIELQKRPFVVGGTCIVYKS